MAALGRPFVLTCLALAIPLLHAAAQTYPACPFTGLPPTAPKAPGTRCPAASTASCCDGCDELSYALNTVAANGSRLLGAISPQLAAVSGSANFTTCSVFVGFEACQLQLEALICGINCNPDSGNFVTTLANGTTLFSVCEQTSTAIYQVCKDLSIPNFPGTLSSFIPDPQEFFGIVFSTIGTAVNITGYSAQIVTGTSNCYLPPTSFPSVPVCCDPLAIPDKCTSPLAPYISDPVYAPFINRSLNDQVCPQAPSSSTASPPPKSGGDPRTVSTIGGVFCLATTAILLLVGLLTVGYP